MQILFYSMSTLFHNVDGRNLEDRINLIMLGLKQSTGEGIVLGLKPIIINGLQSIRTM